MNGKEQRFLAMNISKAWQDSLSVMKGLKMQRKALALIKVCENFNFDVF